MKKFNLYYDESSGYELCVESCILSGLMNPDDKYYCISILIEHEDAKEAAWCRIDDPRDLEKIGRRLIDLSARIRGQMDESKKQ